MIWVILRCLLLLLIKMRWLSYVQLAALSALSIIWFWKSHKDFNSIHNVNKMYHLIYPFYLSPTRLLSFPIKRTVCSNTSFLLCWRDGLVYNMFASKAQGSEFQRLNPDWGEKLDVMAYAYNTSAEKMETGRFLGLNAASLTYVWGSGHG